MIVNGNYKKTAGALGMAASLIGLVFSLKKGKKILSIVFVLSFLLSGYVFFTGSKNYSMLMWNQSRIKMTSSQLEEYLNTKPPVVEIESPEKLKQKLEERNRYFLWLPCEHGGTWYKQSAFLYTRWTLPKNDVVCPTGRVLIHYGKNS